jgi:hypothetical protein
MARGGDCWYVVQPPAKLVAGELTDEKVLFCDAASAPENPPPPDLQLQQLSQLLSSPPRLARA